MDIRIALPYPLDGGTRLRRRIALGYARNASAVAHLLPQSSSAAKLMLTLEVFLPPQNPYRANKVGH
jgi:hypothetical protein